MSNENENVNSAKQAVTEDAHASQNQQPQETAKQDMVPKERIDQLNDQLNREKQQREFFQQQVMLYQNNPQQSTPQPQQAQQPQQSDPFDGIDDDDVLDGKAVKSMFKNFSSQIQSQVQQAINPLLVQSQYPDFRQKVNTVLPRIMQEDPSFAQALRGPNALAATLYKLAAMESNAGNQQKADELNRQAAQEAQREIDAANRPVSAGTSGQAANAAAVDYASMSEEEFAKILNQNRG